MKRKSSAPPPAKAPADTSQWSKSSQQSVAVDFTTEYVDERYECWHCKASCTFTAQDQKYTYEVRKANVNQSRRLCESCWRESLRISKTLTLQQNAWAASKTTLKADKAFLSSWLQLLELQESYVSYRGDVARRNMLRKLLSSDT